MKESEAKALWFGCLAQSENLAVYILAKFSTVPNVDVSVF